MIVEMIIARDCESRWLSDAHVFKFSNIGVVKFECLELLWDQIWQVFVEFDD
jgi:hypothetical protein